MKNRIKELLEEVNQLVATNSDELEALRIKYLSKKGLISEQFNDFRNVVNEEKREVGQLLNELKTVAQDKLTEIKNSFADNDNQTQNIDLTRSADPIKLGTRHPLSLNLATKLLTYFHALVLVLPKGPEIEDDWHVFGALNFPPEHPARDMQDTFFIEQQPDVIFCVRILSVQTRIMAHQKPPIRLLFPGRVYRNEVYFVSCSLFFSSSGGIVY